MGKGAIRLAEDLVVISLVAIGFYVLGEMGYFAVLIAPIIALCTALGLIVFSPVLISDLPRPRHWRS